MDVELVCPRAWFEELLRAGLHPASEGRAYLAPFGTATTPGRLRLLVKAPFETNPSGPGPWLRVRFRSGRPEAAASPEGPWAAELILGRGPAEGRWGGWLLTPEGPARPIRRLFLPGPGMFRLSAVPESEPGVAAEPGGRWSRSRGALGEGAWGRLVGLRIGVVGCGRLGAAIAAALARNGVRGLVLVDPDRVEGHNLGEADGWTEADVGAFKAEALARRLGAECPWVRAEAVAAPVEGWAALHALKGCDLLVCAADREGARRAAGMLAARYHLPLLEAGTGVFADPGGGRRLGLEVGLFLPGQGCRACLEGEAAGAQEGELPWWADRLGSLRSLNLVAAGLALLVLEGLVREEVSGSAAVRWVWGEPARWVGWGQAGRRCGRGSCGRGDGGA
jgi:hypothetical protein